MGRGNGKDPTPFNRVGLCILLVHPGPVRSPCISLRTKATLPSETSLGAVRGNTGPVVERVTSKRHETPSGDSAQAAVVVKEKSEGSLS